MPVQDTKVIDLVVHMPNTDTVILCMVEVRDWGYAGALLPDLQAKFGTYLTYALDGQLTEEYPALAGKPIRFELRTQYSPTEREQKFFDFVSREYLQPEGITFGLKVLGEDPV